MAYAERKGCTCECAVLRAVRMGNQQRCPDEGSVQRPHGMSPEAGFWYSLLPCESMGIKDYDKPSEAKAMAKVSSGSNNWYSPGGVTYYPAVPYVYNTPVYRRDWNADDGYYYTKVTRTLYSGFDQSRLVFSDEYDNGLTLYNSATITATASGTSGDGKTITVLAQSGTTAIQNFAFDIEMEEEELWTN